ncbi:hypothetical protein Vretifemale_6829 [Volvox reticuliferus]|nr:hypothetical protein Vretifemale_6829 [Volvox reticuliferus]
MALVGPAGCGKSWAAAAALAAVATDTDAGAAPELTDAKTADPREGHEGPSPAALSKSESRPHGRDVQQRRQRRHLRRHVATHFCRAGDAASLDPLVMVRSMAFQLACQTRGSLAAFLRKRYLGLSLTALEALTRLDTAFNLLLLNPLGERMPRPASEDGDRPLPAAERLRRQREEGAGEAGEAPEEVVLLVDGVDEAEGPMGRPYDNRILVALRDLFPKLPPRARLLVTLRPQPSHILRSLVFKLDPWVVDGGCIPASTANPAAPISPTTSQLPIRIWVLETLHSLLLVPPPANPPSGSPSAAPAAAIRITSQQPPASLAAAYAQLFATCLSWLSPAQRCGVGAILELLLASPEPLSLHCISRMRLAPSLEHLPGWGVAFRAVEGSYRLQVLHRSLLEWLRGEDPSPSSRSMEEGESDSGPGGPWGSGGPYDCISKRSSEGGRDVAGGIGGDNDNDHDGDHHHYHERLRQYDVAAVLGAVGMSVDPARGHCRLADWVLEDLRQSRRPQPYSLRYAILHLANAAVAIGDADPKESGPYDRDSKYDAAMVTSEDRTATLGELSLGPSELHAARRMDRVRQLDELMLDFNYWRQVYTSRLGAGVLYDLTTLPCLDSPVARDVVRMIQRDHHALDRSIDLIEQLAMETPLTSATRAAAVAASQRRRSNWQDPDSRTPECTTPSPPVEPPQQQCEEPCVVAAPVYPAWPACLRVVRNGEVRSGRQGGISAVRFSPDASLFAAANNLGSVLLHDSTTGERLLRLQIQADYVTDVAFINVWNHAKITSTPGRDQPDAKHAGDGSCDGDGGGHAPPAYTKLKQPQQQHLMVAAAGSDRTIRLWDAISGEELACLPHHQHQGRVIALAVSPDSRHMASVYDDGKVTLWRVPPAESAKKAAAAIQELPTRGSHNDAAFCCTFSPDSQVLASGGKDGCVRLWEVASGEPIGQIDATVTAAPIATAAAANSPASSRPVIATAAAKSAAPGSGSRPPMVKCLAITSGGSSLLVGMSGGEIGLWRSKPSSARNSPTSLPKPPPPPPPQQQQQQQQQRQESQTSPSGASSLQPGLGGPNNAPVPRPAPAPEQTIRPSSWSLHLTLRGHTADVGAVVADRTKDERTAYSSGLDKTVRVWDLVEGCQLAVLYGHSDYVSGCDLSHDGRLLASGSSDGTVRIWDARAAASIPPPQQHALGVMQMAVAPGNGYVATASQDNTVNIWALPALQPQPLQLPPPPSPSPSPSPQSVDNSTLSQTRLTSPEHPLDRPQQQQQEPAHHGLGEDLPGHKSPAAEAVRDETPLAVAGEKAGNTNSCGLGLMMQLTGHSGYVASVAIAPDEVTLATASYDRTVRVYRLDRPSVPELVLSGSHRGFVTAVAFDAWGTRLASGGADGRILFWDAAPWEAHHFAAAANAAAASDGTAAGSIGVCEDCDGAKDGTVNAKADGEGNGGGEWMRPLQIESISGVSSVWSLAWSPVQYLLAAGHNSCAISLCEGLQPGQSRRPSLLKAVYQPPPDDTADSGGGGRGGMNGHVYGVAWSPDGEWLAGAYSGVRGGRARIWDVMRGDMIADFRAHERDVWAVAFDPLDRNVFASCSYDGTAAIWNLSDLRSPARAIALRGHQGSLRSVAFLAQRAIAATAATGDKNKNTKAASPEEAASSGQGGLVRGAGNGEDDVHRVIITAGTDATVRVWSYREGLRRREVSYICPWALTG